MLARMWKVGKIKIKVYQDIVDFIRDEACKDFDELTPYILRYEGEDTDFCYYSVELPVNMLNTAMKEIKEELDSWIKAYREKKKESKEENRKDEYIWERARAHSL